MSTSLLDRDSTRPGYGEIIGQSAAMRELFRQIDRLVSTDITVLIHGESGTGKELVAAALHRRSARRAKPFVAVNCAGIPETLQESELFGHERGAFTGATERHIGKFEQANGGTLFLDEVAELTLAAQAKLLRALQSHSFQRVGGTGDVRSDFRLIAASHQRLADLVRAGKFREDLYYRIAVFELDVPALRDRGADILLLANCFLEEIGAREGRRMTLSASAARLLVEHPWPGNVRELENAMHRVLIAADGPMIEPEDLPPAIRATVSPLSAVPAASQSASPVARLDDVERGAIVESLLASGGNVSQATRALGIGRTTLYRKLKQYGLARPTELSPLQLRAS